MKIFKIKDVKTPYKNIGDAGIDFFIPNDFVKTHLPPNNSILIPSGIKALVPEGYMLTAFNKSGVCTKKNLIVGACVVDSTYSGEIHLHLINVGKTAQELNPGDKITQFVLVAYLEEAITEAESEEELFKNHNSSRGDGAFGSTGN